MFGVGMILSGTLALLPSMMQVLKNYPVFDAGWMMAPRGFGTMLAMLCVARVINRVDYRLFILVGFLAVIAAGPRSSPAADDGRGRRLGRASILFR
jgi:MFS transporter, DHA2 family, multidrug resistance protein